jgi:hypothetical protein
MDNARRAFDTYKLQLVWLRLFRGAEAVQAMSLQGEGQSEAFEADRPDYAVGQAPPQVEGRAMAVVCARAERCSKWL